MKKLAAVLLLLSLGGTICAADFNGDGRDDVGIFRPASGLWAVRGVTRTYFGAAGDIPVPGDYNHNGRAEIAVYRPASGLWAIKGVSRVYFGSGNDIPLDGGGGRWTPFSGGIYYTGGRAGIGTATPRAEDLFEVSGGRAFFHNSNYHGVEIANSAWTALYIHDSPYHGIGISSCAQHGIKIDTCGENFIRAGETDGPTTFTVQSTGHVGIGTQPGDLVKVNVLSNAFMTGRFESTQSGGIGIMGVSESGWGVYGATTTGKAGHFFGDVEITDDLDIAGTLTKGGGSFKIDHPLDPENLYLSHSFVESPDMMNVYNGNVILDEDGEATVELPEYFEALNRDFRYQLTPLGTPGPDLHISRKISGNSFAIAGGRPGMEVSWQVTGVRDDPWARQNPIIVEEEKPGDEKGYYLHPEVYGRCRLK